MLLKWIFSGGADGSELAEKRGEQRAYATDIVVDECLGDARLISFGDTPAWLRLEFAGVKEVKLRTAGHIYVKVQREERTMRGAGTLTAFLGAKAVGVRADGSPAAAAAPAAVNGSASRTKRKQPANGKGLGKTVASGGDAAPATPAGAAPAMAGPRGRNAAARR